MIPSPNFESRGGARVRLIALHTSEGARDVTSLGHYLANPAVQASYHAAFDDHRMETYVDYDKAAWAVLSANRISDNGCMCAFAAWPRSEWLTHATMLELAAQWVAARCTARKVPIRHLTLPEVAACAKDPNHPGGVIGHWDWTLGAKDGTHTDPGPSFPWDVVIARAQQIAKPATSHQPLEDAQVIWRLVYTPTKDGAKAGDTPDATWPAIEDTIALPGPSAGWRGRIICWPVAGNPGVFIQEAWFGIDPNVDQPPSVVHVVDKPGRLQAMFTVLNWEAPPQARFLVVRYSAPGGGSIGIECEH